MSGGWTQGQREVPGVTKPLVVEPQVQSLGLEDPLEKKMETHSSILAWRIPWAEERGSLHPMGSQESDMTEQLHHSPLLVGASLVPTMRPLLTNQSGRNSTCSIGQLGGSGSTLA